LIKKECDNLSFENDHFKTVKYGCCGGDDAFAVYDFRSDLIIKGDVKIIKASIPNSEINFFASYKDNDDDSSFMGTVFYSFNNIDKYQIKISKTKTLPFDCEYRVPDIFIFSSDSNDKFRQDNNEYTLWSLNKIHSKSQINNISLKVVFECNAYPKNDTIIIPIINGKPFGKDAKIQTYTYINK